MEVRQGYSYHIKDEFFDKIHDKYLMSNKEAGNYRLHFLAIQDSKNEELYWMIPISSQVEKYKDIVDNAFLIQNAFPVIKKYFDHVHTVEQKPVIIHNRLNRELTVNLREVLAMYKRGIRLIFPDIEYIQRKMEEELSTVSAPK